MDESIKRRDTSTPPQGPDMAPLTEHVAMFRRLFGVLDQAYEDMKAEANNEGKQA